MATAGPIACRGELEPQQLGLLELLRGDVRMVPLPLELGVAEIQQHAKGEIDHSTFKAAEDRIDAFQMGDGVVFPGRL